MNYKTSCVKQTQLFLSITIQLFVTLNARIELVIPDDQKVVSGTEVELVCEITDTRDEVDECFWESPKRDKYYSDDDEEDGIEVRFRSGRNSEDYRCILTIERATLEHAGHWECVVGDRRETVGIFGYILVYDKAKFQVLLDGDQKQVIADLGVDLELICPTNDRFERRRSNRHSSISLCRWFPPYREKPLNIIDVHGVVHNYKRDHGIEPADSIDDGQCGILVRNVQLKHFGNWKCHLLRRKGIGSQSTEAVIRVDPGAETLKRSDDDDDFDPDEPMV